MKLGEGPFLCESCPYLYFQLKHGSILPCSPLPRAASVKHGILESTRTIFSVNKNRTIFENIQLFVDEERVKAGKAHGAGGWRGRESPLWFFQSCTDVRFGPLRMAEHWKIVAFELWVWRRLAGGSSQSILKEISPEYLPEGLMVKLKLQYFGHLMGRANLLEKI